MRTYGLAEIARECGKTIHAVRKWQQRGTLPPPTERLVQGYVWTGPEIEAFLATRRSP